MRTYVWCLGVAILLATGVNRPVQAAGPLQIVTESLPAGSIGVSYAQQVATSGGSCPATGNATSTIDSGALPIGLSIVSPAGVERWTIQGVPTASGTFQFALHIRWTHQGVSPFDPNCVDEAVKTLTITIQAPQSPLTVDRAQISTTYHMNGFPPPSETVKVTAAGSAVPFTAQAASSGGNWLSVTPLSAVTPASLEVSFLISGQQPGVYTGTVTLTSGSANPVAIAVTLTVVADTNVVLRAAPSSLTFSFVTGGAAPPAQSLAVTVTGNAVVFQADVNAPPTGKWLSVSPSGAATPATLTVQVDPKGLSPGTYNGTIALHLAFVATIAQTIPVTFTVQSPPLLPTITQNGVVNAANLTGAIAPGTWVSIFGNNLSATTRPWRDADFTGGKLPAALDGVSVTINGKAAAVAFVSPTQVNVLAPDDTATGLVSVQVKAPAGTSADALVLEQTAAPALFQFRAPSAVYAAGTHADGSYLAGAALVQQGISGTPAKPGETIVVYGTGFGATQPSISATALVPSALPLANPQELRVRIGGADAAIVFAGLISPGLYQFNVVVPELPDGDRTIVAELRGLLTRPDLMLAVQK
jgi:uncharacterized protein (TIGR03437 family)